jgi:AhpD family alkylhydroperoxidase
MSRVALFEQTDPDDPVLDAAWSFGVGQASTILNSYRLYAHVPAVFAWYLPFVVSLQIEGGGGKLDGRTKQLAVLATVTTNACEYCTQHNVTLGAAKGIEEDTIAAVASKGSLSSLSARDRAVVEWTRLVTTNEARYKTAEFDALGEFFTEAEIVELTWVSAMFCMINRLHDSLWLDVDTEDTLHANVAWLGLTESDLAEYADRLAAALKKSTQSGSPVG